MDADGTSPYFEFKPELTVEVTMVCDRACPGCYAPNLISRDDPETALRKHPALFLKPEALGQRLSEITSSVKRQLASLSLRGGEPTMHPALPALLKVAARFAHHLFVESHAKWALPGGPDAAGTHETTLRALARPNVTLKVSFDSMHETAPPDLKLLLEHLDRRRVRWLVAITEPDDERFAQRRAQCAWVPDAKIVRHEKATRASQLYVPPFGVILPDGRLLRSLSVRRGF